MSADIVAAVLAAFNPASAGEFDATFPAAQLVRFDLESLAGDVDVRAQRNLGEVRVTARPVQWDEGCSLDMGRDQERAWARIQAAMGRDDGCRLDFVVVVNPETHFTLRLGSGDVRISGLAADITADIGYGDLLLHAVTGALDAEMGHGQLEGIFSGHRIHVELGSGGVHLTQLVSPTAVDVGAGNVELHFKRAPVGQIEVHTGTGAVRILLPPGTPVATAVVSRDVHLPRTHDALTRIEVGSGFGRVAIEPHAAVPPVAATPVSDHP